MFEMRLYFELELYKVPLYNGSYEVIDSYDVDEQDPVLDILNENTNEGVKFARLFFICGDLKTLLMTFKKKITKRGRKRIVNWVIVKDNKFM
jgi:thiamine biosynthesis protein ThiC